MIRKENRFKKGLPIALLFVSLLSISLNVFLYSKLREIYTALYIFKLDPLGLSYFQDTQGQKPDDELLTFVFFGDSRAAQWPNPDVDGFWYVNRGIGSQTTPQIVNRFEEHVTSLQPDVILLQMGVNDLKTIPLFSYRKEEIISTCKENILSVVEQSRQLDSVVVISTIFPTGTIPLERRLVWSDDIEEAIVEVNDYIYTLASDQVIVFDSAKLLVDPNGKLKQDYSMDELHLNASGYQVLNIELAKLLEEIKEDSQ